MSSLLAISFAIASLLVGIFRFLPNPLDPVLWTTPNKLPEFKGPTSVNTILQTSKLRYYDFSGPECFAADDDGEVYAGISDGTVVKFNAQGDFIQKIFFVGGYIQRSRSRNGLDNASHSLLAVCSSLSNSGDLAWNTSQERRCGRPLGLRFARVGRKHVLYVLDAYWGLFRLNIDNPYDTTHLITPSHRISTHLPRGNVDNHVFETPMFYNDLDVLSNGDIVFTDSSHKFTRSENRQEILDGAGRGRLFHYSIATKELKVLLCGLHFPNGVQKLVTRTTEIEDIVFAELTRFRLIRVNVTQVQAHEKVFLRSCAENGPYEDALQRSIGSTGISIFTDSLHGLADNLRVDFFHEQRKALDRSEASNQRSYYLLGIGGKSVKPFSLLWTALQTRWLRVAVGKLVPMRWVERLIPRYGLVLVVDDTGEIVSSLHDPSGKVALISVAFRHPRSGDLWLGSHSEHYIAIVPHRELPTSWSNRHE